METLRQMVAANVGVTLMPVLAIKPPIAPTENMVLRNFEAPQPSRTIALVWRKSSPLGDMLGELSACLKVNADLLAYSSESQ